MEVDYLVLHTAGYDGKHDSLEDIIRWHKNRGFRTIGYHYYIRKDGSIRKGREDDRIGAHCRAGGMNTKSLGICFEGHHDKEHWTSEQTSAFMLLSMDLMESHNVPQENVIGHREAYEGEPKKTCPGTKIDMNWVRTHYAGKDPKIDIAYTKEIEEGKINFEEKIDRL
jgi:N-acetyl-anhydromuramyl-L-alanine amidase AmpD